MYPFRFTPTFIKDLEKLDRRIRNQISKKIVFFSQSENPFFFAKRLKGSHDLFRFRMGDYRIVFQFQENIIFLLAVDDRKDIYKEF